MVSLEKGKLYLQNVVTSQVANALSVWLRDPAPSSSDQDETVSASEKQLLGEITLFFSCLQTANLAIFYRYPESISLETELLRRYIELEKTLEKKIATEDNAERAKELLLQTRTQWVRFNLRFAKRDRTAHSLAKYLAENDTEDLLRTSNSTVFQIIAELFESGQFDAALSFADDTFILGRPGSIKFLEAWVEYVRARPSKKKYTQLFSVLEKYRDQNSEKFREYLLSGFPDESLLERDQEFDWMSPQEFQKIIDRAETNCLLWTNAQGTVDVDEVASQIPNTFLRLKVLVSYLQEQPGEQVTLEDELSQITSEIQQYLDVLSTSQKSQEVALKEQGTPEDALTLDAALSLFLLMIKKLLTFSQTDSLKELVLKVALDSIQIASLGGQESSEKMVQSVLTLCAIENKNMLLFPEFFAAGIVTDDMPIFWYCMAHAGLFHEEGLSVVASFFFKSAKSDREINRFGLMLLHQGLAQGHLHNWRELYDVFVQQTSSFELAPLTMSSDERAEVPASTEEERSRKALQPLEQREWTGEVLLPSMEVSEDVKNEEIPADNYLFQLQSMFADFALLAAHLGDTHAVFEMLSSPEIGGKFLDTLLRISLFERGLVSLKNQLFRY